MENLEETFNFCNNVEVHVKPTDKLDNVVAVASEHNFRGIVVDSCKLLELIKSIKKNGSDIMPICQIDGPEGNSSTDIRAYSILSAKEKGAKEIEIFAPLNFIQNKDFRKIYEDLQNLINVSQKNNIVLKYCLNDMYKSIPDDTKTKLCRSLSAVQVGNLSFNFAKIVDSNHSDNIIKMRFFKNKISSKIKTFIKDASKEDFASYVKAGVDTIGLDWEIAPYLVHAYESMFIKK